MPLIMQHTEMKFVPIALLIMLLIVTRRLYMVHPIMLYIKTRSMPVMVHGGEIIPARNVLFATVAALASWPQVARIPPQTSTVRVKSRSGAAGGAGMTAKTSIMLTTWFPWRGVVTMGQAIS